MPTSREAVPCATPPAAAQWWGRLQGPHLCWAWLCVFAFIFALTASHAVAVSPADFLRANRIPPVLAEQLLTGDDAVSSCSANEGMLFCARGRHFPNITGNDLAREAVLKGLGISVRAALDKAVAQEVRARDLRNASAVGEALGRARAEGMVTLRGIRFTTFCRGDWCGAVAAVPLADAADELPPVYARPGFVDLYCAASLAAAQRRLAEGNFRVALPALKELYALRCGHIEAWLLAVEISIHEGERTEAAKIARELLEAPPGELDASGAEKLGDLFLELDMSVEAEKAFNLAAQLLTRQ